MAAKSAPLSGPTLAFEASGQTVEKTFEPPVDRLILRRLLASQGTLDLEEHPLAPLRRGRPRQLTGAIEEGLERLVAGDAGDEIEPKALGSLGGLGGDDLKGEGQGLVDAVGIRVPEPAGRHLTVDVITAVQISKSGEETAG